MNWPSIRSFCSRSIITTSAPASAASKSWNGSTPSRSIRAGISAGGAHDPHHRAERLQAQHVRTRDAAVQDVAADRHPEAVEHAVGARPARARLSAWRSASASSSGLRRMLVLAVAGVEHRAVDPVRNQPHRALELPWRMTIASARIALSVTAVSISVSPFFTLELRRMHVDHVGAEPLAGDLEAQQRARRVLEEGVDDRQPGELVGVLLGLAVERDPLLGLVEQVEDFVGFEMADAEQARGAGSARAGRIAARRRGLCSPMSLKPGP